MDGSPCAIGILAPRPKPPKAGPTPQPHHAFSVSARGAGRHATGRCAAAAAPPFWPAGGVRGFAVSLALIGGTGLASLPGLELRREHALDTPYGHPSMAIREGRLHGQGVLFLHRHGESGRPIPPHLVNYRANIWALRELGATRVVAANAVGAINPRMHCAGLVIPDQLIDYTWGREHSFDDGSGGALWHIDFTEPFDAPLRRQLGDAARRAEVAYTDGAVLAVTQGPRLETAAEIRRFASAGCDLVGMTSMPEAALARELKLPYASVCMVVNAAAGLGDQPLNLDTLRETLSRETQRFERLVAALLQPR